MINKRPITNLEVLNEAYCYSKSSGFSRGMRGEIGDAVMLFISGTARIDEKGQYIDKFQKQTERAYYNIQKLLESEGA